MSINKTIILVLLTVVLAIFFSYWAAPFLPERVASHWVANGVANGFQSKDAFLWTMPVIMTVIALLLIFIPFIDPLKTSFQPVRGAYYVFVLGFMLFMDYIHALSIFYNLGFAFNLFSMLMPAFAALIAGTGFLLDRVRPNWFVGVRTPWTLSSTSVWINTHKLGALLFKIAAIIILIGWFIPSLAIWFLLVPILGVSLFWVVYSYCLYRQEQNSENRIQ